MLNDERGELSKKKINNYVSTQTKKESFYRSCWTAQHEPAILGEIGILKQDKYNYLIIAASNKFTRSSVM